MAEVKVLIEGYSVSDGEEFSCSTVTLIKDGDLIIIVDPGTMKDQAILIKKLREENLTIGDVNVVCVTHGHPDHYRNVGMFPKAKLLEYWGLWDRDSVEDWESPFSKDIEIIKTPGHDDAAITLLVKIDQGKIAVCGDVFWWTTSEKQEVDINKKDPFAKNQKRLVDSRKKLLEVADYIIPGHGKMFKVEK